MIISTFGLQAGLQIIKRGTVRYEVQFRKWSRRGWKKWDFSKPRRAKPVSYARWWKERPKYKTNSRMWDIVG